MTFFKDFPRLFGCLVAFLVTIKHGVTLEHFTKEMLKGLASLWERTLGNNKPVNSTSDSDFVKRLRQLLEEGDRKQVHEMARRGFPEAVRAEAWLEVLQVQQMPSNDMLIFNVLESVCNYKEALRVVFGTETPTHFQPPCFGATICAQSLLGLDAGQVLDFKRILCIIAHNHPSLVYTPIIPVLVGLLLSWLEADQVLGCMASLIRGHAIPAAKRQDWSYFPLHRRDYLVFERVFEDLIHRFVPSVSKHIGRIQQEHRDYAPEWYRLLSELLLGIIPRPAVLRIMDAYLVEGYKVLLRFALAHLIRRQSAILASQTPAQVDEALFGAYGESQWNEQQEQRKLFKAAYAIHFSRTNINRYRSRNRKLSVGDFDTEDRLLIFHRPLPQLLHPSSFVREEEWAALWSWIPSRYRLLNLDLVYSSREHGRLLTTLYQRCATSEPLLLLIETHKGTAMGAYLSKSFQHRSGPTFYGTGECFLFSLRPRLAHYPWKTDSGSSSFISASDLFLACGTGGYDFGLWLDKYMNRVQSCRSTTYGNEPMVDARIPEDREVYCVEVFRFV